MKQFRIILDFELKNYLKNKVFVGVTLFLVAVIAVVMFFPRLTGATLEMEEGPDVTLEEEWADGEGDEADGPVMLLAMEEGDNPAILEVFRSAFWEYRVESTGETAERIKGRILDGEAECAVLLHDLTSYTYYVDTLSMYDETPYMVEEVLTHLARMDAMMAGGLDPQSAEAILTLSVEGEVESLGKDQMENFFYTYIMIFALYMVILLYGQMVATNVATEKSSRAMELLITSADPVSMMFGKVIASCLAGFCQLICVFGSALLFFRMNQAYWEGNMIVNSIFNMPGSLLSYMLLFFVLGFFIYAFLYGAIGSTASKVEDINTSAMPITLLFIAGFMVVMFSMASGSVDNVLMTVCSYVPFTSPMAMFTRIAMSTVPWYEIVLSVAILIVSVLGVGVLAARIYRVGVLLYGTPPKPMALLKAIRRG